MKRNVSILLIVSCILIIFTLILFAEEVKYDFRKTTWGMNEEQVKATEEREVGYEGNSVSGYALGYEVEIDVNNYYCYYLFLENKLYQGRYMLNEKHVNKNLYIDDYEELKEVLTKKYGNPINKNEIYWEDDLFKDNKVDWGLAISVGDLYYFSGWETPITKISLELDGDNYKIRLILIYESKELKEWADKILEEKAKAEL